MIILRSKPWSSFCHGIIKRVGRVLIMKPETRRRILDAYDEAFKLLGQPNFTSGIKYVCGELQKTHNQLKAARTRQGLEATFGKEAEPTPEQLEALVGTIRLLPYLLRK